MAASKTSRSLLSLLQKRFLLTSSAALSPPTAPLPTSIQFLVNSCGLTSKSALSVSKKFQIRENNLQNSQSVLQFLKAHDFSETHISNLIEKRPKTLLRKIEDNLKGKFDFFIENGFAGQLLPQLILSNPLILERALDSHIKPSLLYFKSILGTSEKIIAASKRSLFLLTCDWNSIVLPNIDFLIKEGVPVDRVAKLFLFHPQVLQRKHDRMIYAVSLFIYALTTMMQSSESTLKKKVEVLKSLGWTEEEIFRAFKQDPAILRFSEEKIRSVMDFLVNTVGLRPQTIIANPLFLHYSINKRLRPRYNVLKALESKKLFDEGVSIRSLLKMTEKKFMKNYVAKYEHSVPGILDTYKGTGKPIKLDT
ncbi:transcription termination factor MTERF [Salix suchowensis]|nr:transcription termination factor MTERF [Salix suchowensis]